MTPPRLGSYETAHGPELLIARGPAHGPQVLIVQPLFEEAGFTRSLLADLARALAENGIGSWLFDLPGLGDSLTPLQAVRLADWRAAADAAAAAVHAASGRAPSLASIRGGALLIDGPAWRLAPCDGAAVLRPLRRAATLGESGGIGGWPIAEALAAELAGAPLPPAHAAGRDVHWATGTPPWRRAEPWRDPASADALAADLAGWVAACAAR